MAKQFAINRNMCTIKHKFDLDSKDLISALESVQDKVFVEIKEQLEKLKGIKWYICVSAKFTKIINDHEIESLPFFHGKTRAMLKYDDLESQYSDAVGQITENMEKWVREGSGWVLEKILSVFLCIVKYQPLYGSSYIPTPSKISHSRQGIINIKNEDQKCFLWSVLAALHPDPNRKYRVAFYKKFEDELIMSGIDYPVRIEDLQLFEELNSQISINVFGYEKEDVYPIRITKERTRRSHINLLFLTNAEGNTHYCLISNLSKLLTNLTKKKCTYYYCNYCLRHFIRTDLLEKHVLSCISKNVESICLKNTSTDESSYIPTPKELSKNSKGVVNIKNKDQKSFIWAILSAIYSTERTVEYFMQFESIINMSGIEYPVNVKDLSKFEDQNPDISVNVFAFENGTVYPVRITKKKFKINHINLLLLTNVEGKQHYCSITSLSRLLGNLTRHNEASYYCNYCLHRFRSQQTLYEHEPLCTPHGAQKTRLPNEQEKWMYFKNYTLTHKVPFTIYCDFESFVAPIEENYNEDEMFIKTKTMNKAKHTPSGFCYVIIDADGTAINSPVVYSGPNVVDKLLQMLMEEAETLVPLIKRNIPMNMTNEDQKVFENATQCHLCNKSFENDKVANHNHMNGKFLGAAHNSCNLNYQVPDHIPVFFHNLRGYDCHHLMKGFGKFTNQKITCIAKNSEQYTSVSLGPLRFLDSLQFMNASLDQLVNNLAAEGTLNFKILKQCMGDKNIELLIRKGVYPYNYMTDESKFEETKLPAKEFFYNDLTQEDIDEKDYEHAQNIWNVFGMRNMKDYHDVYLKSDVLLLADTFENFRTTSIEYYDIDPCNCYSAPGLAWNAMLKMTNVNLELLTDIDQHLFIEKGIRGGIAMISNRYAKANNPELPDYDPQLPTTHLTYLDCNNLYGTAMSEPLPEADFRWLNQDEIDELDVENVSDNNEIGYILEVDLEYPKHLHDLHSDYPLAPEKRMVTEDMLSPYSKHVLDNLNNKYGPTYNFTLGKVQKLLTTLSNKDKYVIHYRNLKLYLELGMVLKKVHRVLAFTQSKWLLKFIHFNTEMRKQAKNVFQKDFFKLMNNSVYGKSLENVRSRIDFHLVNNEKTLTKLSASPRLKTFFHYDENLAGMAMKKQTILLNRPIYVGFTVLDLSKLMMYRFHYNWAVKKYGKNVTLCMTDTDSLLYRIETNNIFQDIKADLHLFDTSDYPQNHMCYSSENNKVLGKFKDETNGNPIWEFIGLRAKCYSILDCNEREKKVAKGVPRVAIRRQLKHEVYKECLFNHALKVTTAKSIVSKKHQIYTQFISKMALSPFDDKRYILENGTKTLAYGHYKIGNKRQIEEEENSLSKRFKLDHSSEETF